MTSLQLSEGDADKFKTFQKHYEFISAILESGFPWSGQTISLDIDPAGNLKSVRYEKKILVHLQKK